MFTVFMKGNSLIFQPGFETWGQAELYGWDMFGPGNFEIVPEWQRCTKQKYKICASCPIDFKCKSDIMNISNEGGTNNVH